MSLSVANTSAIERAVPSFGASITTSPLRFFFVAVRFASALDFATLKSQSVVICPMILPISSLESSALSESFSASEEFAITNVPSAIFG